MKQAPLGALSTTILGCGDVRLATAAARGLDAREVERALHHALELGVRLVDVADEPDAERLAGAIVRALRLRDDAVIATRVPRLAPRPGTPRRDVLPERLPPGYVQERVEASLRATRLDALPLVQLAILPAWRDSAAWPELAGTCARLVREGKVMLWGAWLDDLPRAAELVEEPWLAAVQLPYSLCERAADPLLDAFAGKLAVLARRPLAGGALTGQLGPGVQLPPRDDRSEIEDAQLEQIAIAIARLAPLVHREPPAARSCDAARAALERTRRPPDLEALTVAELALRFVLDRGALALPRLHRHAHVPDAIAAASAPPLSPGLCSRLAEIFPSTTEQRSSTIDRP